MKNIIWFILLFLRFNCLSQDTIVDNPRITFGGLSDSVVNKDELLNNAGIIFSNDTSNNIECLKAVDFSFRIEKLNGKIFSIETNTCPDRNGWSDKKWERYDKRVLKRISQGKYVKCGNGSVFNRKQLKAIRKMKTGETLYIDTVTTRASSCSCLSRKWIAGLKYTIK